MIDFLFMAATLGFLLGLLAGLRVADRQHAKLDAIRNR